MKEEMKNKGWISLYRGIQDSAFWLGESFSRGQALIDLLLLVNHSEQKIIIDGELYTVKPGERITSIRFLSDRWKWSRTKVRNYLKILEKNETILCEIDNKKTKIAFINWNEYQKKEPPLTIENSGVEGNKKQEKSQWSATEKPVKSQWSASEKPVKDTNNNDNNNNNENNEKNEKNDDKKRSTPYPSLWHKKLKEVFKLTDTSYNYLFQEAEIKEDGNKLEIFLVGSKELNVVKEKTINARYAAMTKNILNKDLEVKIC